MASANMMSEFTLPTRREYVRRTPERWVLSHILQHWYLVLLTVLGAAGNAALAALVPIFLGQAFNAILETPPNTSTLIPTACGLAGRKSCGEPCSSYAILAPN